MAEAEGINRWVVTGNTYNHRNLLKRLGLRFDGSSWSTTDAKVAESVKGNGRFADARLGLVGRDTASPVCACGTVCYGDCRS